MQLYLTDPIQSTQTDVYRSMSASARIICTELSVQQSAKLAKSPVPRHNEVKDSLCRLIRAQLGL
jgi:hypothetical protein